MILGFRLLLVVTYPINLMIADGKNYLRMLIKGTSDLIHAPGYPFIMGLPWRNPLGWALSSSFPTIFERLLCASQHAINVGCLYLGYRTVREIFGTAPATLFVLFYGMHFHVFTATSSVAPEWLQGSLVMVIGFLLLKAWKADQLSWKIGYYGVIGFVACMCFLVKFNSIALLTLPACAMTADFFRSRRSVVAPVFGALVLAGSYALFVVAFHLPSTGTTIITLDKAWILLERLAFFAPGRTLSPETGIQTARLLAFNAVLPWPERQGPIARIDSVPLSVREPFRKRYNYIFSADQMTLDGLLRDVTIPKPYPFSSAYLPIANSIGLEESNRLGKLVYFEHIRAYPRLFLKSIRDLTIRTIMKPKRLWLYPIRLQDDEFSRLRWGFGRLNNGVGDGRHQFYRYRDPVVWIPGVRLATFHFDLLQFPPLWVSILIAVGVFGALFRLWQERVPDLGVLTFLASTLTVVLYVIFSNTVYHFRWKEVHPILPILCMLTAVVLVELADAIVPDQSTSVISRKE
jgi:hypothetical protein